MEKGLTGKQVVICGSRKIEEISTLIEKQGGVPLVRPLQGTVFLAEKEVEPDIREFVENGADWVIFTTGIGFETLVELAAKLGLQDSFLKIIREAKIASRGYKTLSALKKYELKPLLVDVDGTTKGLALALENVDFSGTRVMVQLHGETAPELTKFLEERGATVKKILPYQHIAPDNETVERLIHELQFGKCDAVCFTTATQVHSLFEYARENNIYPEIMAAFKEKVVAVAVGKVTEAAIKEEGIERVVVPENERMGAMVIELAKYYLS
ncbi:uroporphyrinogen-III synthase [Bacillaceae bacterium C204]|uniref:uroporphyrinogen-III synthase n=1 Tax=Neobacillus sp. 204 TaxID=3383351 RepID=UPI00397DE07F